jgi:hypothetical protein
MTDPYTCIVRDAYQVISVDVALHAPSEEEVDVGEGSRFFPTTNAFALQLVRDMLRPGAKGGGSTRAAHGTLAKALAGAWSTWQDAGKDLDSFCAEHAAAFVEATRIVKTLHLPMTPSESKDCWERHLASLKRSPQPKNSVEKWWDQTHGALPRALYAIRLRDVTWLRDIGKNIYFDSPPSATAPPPSPSSAEAPPSPEEPSAPPDSVV